MTVKLNLLDISEENVIFEKGRELTAPVKTTKEEREFSLESVDELFQSSQSSKQSEPPKAPGMKQTKPASEKITPPRSSPPKVKLGANMEEEGFDRSPGRKSFLIIGLVIILVFGAVAAYYFLFMKEDKLTPAGPSEQLAEQTPPVESPPGVDPQIMAFYSQNKATNLDGLNMAQQLMNVSEADIRFALIVLTPGQIQSSVLTGSQEALNSYQANLKQHFPASEIRMVNTEDMLISGENRIWADFTFALAEPQTTARLDGFETITSSAIQSRFGTLAQKHQISLQSLKKGGQTRGNQVNQIKYYSILSGDR